MYTICLCVHKFNNFHHLGDCNISCSVVHRESFYPHSTGELYTRKFHVPSNPIHAHVHTTYMNMIQLMYLYFCFLDPLSFFSFFYPFHLLKQCTCTHIYVDTKNLVHAFTYTCTLYTLLSLSLRCHSYTFTLHTLYCTSTHSCHYGVLLSLSA